MRADAGATRGPAEELRRAAALVFVDNLDLPVLDDPDAHHLAHVLRLRAGETVAAGDGRGRWRLCRVARATSRGSLSLEPSGPVELAPATEPALTIGFALQKGDRPEWTVQKLTECGIDRIVPLLSARTVVHLDDDGRRRRGERLRRVAREAAGQCRRAHLPEVTDPFSFEDALALGARGDLTLAEPGAPSLAARVRTLLVGPEGGWSPDELAAAPALAGLGPLVLRAETAALVAGVLLATARGSFTLRVNDE